MSATGSGEYAPVDKPTGEQLEAVFFAALEARDFQGVADVLAVMVPIDPRRAVELYDHLQTAISVAKAVHPR